MYHNWPSLLLKMTMPKATQKTETIQKISTTEFTKTYSRSKTRNHSTKSNSLLTASMGI